MKKITIGITIDHVFRNTYGRIIELYKKHYIEEPKDQAEDNDGFVTSLEIDESGNTKTIQVEFVPPVLNLPITSTNLMDHIPFENIEELNDFIFSEFPLEIFGYSKESEPGSIQIFNNWNQELPSHVEVVLLSNEVGRTKPATFFFLSKTGFEGNNIKFIDDSIDIWEICDILITSSATGWIKPENKKVIIIEKEYNKHLTGDLQFKSLFDLFESDITTVLKMEEKPITLIQKLKKCLKIGKN